MADLLLQLWGGGFYLLNKILFSVAEGREQGLKRRLKIAGWVIYLAGVPAWVIILIGKHNWIAASIESGGVPAMLFGLYNVFHSERRLNQVFDRFASLCTWAAIALGVGYSFYDYGGLSSLTQFLEIGVMVGFLLGSYLLAKSNHKGWLFFMLMNGSMATLMFVQAKPFLAGQQLVSLCFVIYGFIASLRSHRIR